MIKFDHIYCQVDFMKELYSFYSHTYVYLLPYIQNIRYCVHIMETVSLESLLNFRSLSPPATNS